MQLDGEGRKGGKGRRDKGGRLCGKEEMKTTITVKDTGMKGLGLEYPGVPCSVCLDCA